MGAAGGERVAGAEEREGDAGRGDCWLGGVRVAGPGWLGKGAAGREDWAGLGGQMSVGQVGQGGGERELEREHQGSTCINRWLQKREDTIERRLRKSLMIDCFC